MDINKDSSEYRSEKNINKNISDSKCRVLKSINECLDNLVQEKVLRDYTEIAYEFARIKVLNDRENK
ncbi:MAG: hypothetical protein RSE00_05065 [Clostridia bacterium]